MGQITSGFRAILSHPAVYGAFQNLMGARQKRREFVRDFVRPEAGYAVLDFGCGPAAILDCLPLVRYWGFDISRAYIQQATSRFGDRGHFSCKALEPADLEHLPRFDIALAIGVLHHLDDAQATELLRLAHQALRPGGRFVSLDPTLVAGQNRIARLLVRYDRGQNVREPEHYRALAAPFFPQVRSEVRHQSWIPYTHFMMECTRP